MIEDSGKNRSIFENWECWIFNLNFKNFGIKGGDIWIGLLGSFKVFRSIYRWGIILFRVWLEWKVNRILEVEYGDM